MNQDNTANLHERDASQVDSHEMSDRIIKLAMQASISQLVNAVAHQINNSLTPILGYSQLLQENGIGNEESKLYSKRISEEAENLSKIVDNMLVFARRRNVGREMVSINALLKETVALQSYEIEKRDINIQMILDSGIPPTVVDPFQMQVVFLSIIRNALEALSEYTEEGNITILTKRAPQAENLLHIEFTDNGPGINPQVRSEIFDSFFTTKNRTTNSIAGLGLTICQHLIQEQSGQISVRSEWGHGTTVLLDIPIVELTYTSPGDSLGTLPIWT